MSTTLLFVTDETWSPSTTAARATPASKTVAKTKKTAVRATLESEKLE